MKRAKPAKRRQRRTGLSPYARYGKKPYTYSADYQQWKASVIRRVPTAQASTRHANAKLDTLLEGLK
jgi:hypothetical protein